MRSVEPVFSFMEKPAISRRANGCAMKNHRAFQFFLLVFAMAFSLPLAVFSAPAVPPASLVNVCSAIVYDLDNDAILFEQNVDQRIPPASLTKVMSMFLAFDHIKAGHATLDSDVSVSSLAAGTGGSRMGLVANETVPLENLLMGMAVSSGNDASHAVAEYVGGSESAFVRMMNVKAAALGMHNSNFQNPHGLPANAQYTTARDMLTLARAYLMAHPEALRFHNTKIMNHRGQRTWNKNPLLGQYPGADGLKTGWIRASGYNLIFTASNGRKRLLAVIMGAPDIYKRSGEAARLLDAAFKVCDNEAVSVAAALDIIPLDERRIDPRKTAREAGIIKTRAVAGFSKKARTGAGRAGGAQARSGKQTYPNKKASRQVAKDSRKNVRAAKNRQHAQRQRNSSRTG